MGKLTRSHMVETAIWFVIVAVFFGFSFEFDQPIEIYEFGATGWPRVVLLMLLLAAIGAGRFGGLDYFIDYFSARGTRVNEVGTHESVA